MNIDSKSSKLINQIFIFGFLKESDTIPLEVDYWNKANEKLVKYITLTECWKMFESSS